MPSHHDDRLDPGQRLLAERPPAPDDVARALGDGSQSAWLAPEGRLRDAPPACRRLLWGSAISAGAGAGAAVWWVLVYEPVLSPGLHGDARLALVCAGLAVAALIVASRAIAGGRAWALTTLGVAALMAVAGFALLTSHATFVTICAVVYLAGCGVYAAGGTALSVPRPAPSGALFGPGSQEAAALRRAAAERAAWWMDAVAGLLACAALLALSAWWALRIPAAGRSGAPWTALLLLLTACPAAALLVARVRSVVSPERRAPRGALVVWALVSAFFALFLSLPDMFRAGLLTALYAILVFIAAPALRRTPPDVPGEGEVPAWLMAGRSPRLVGDDERPWARGEPAGPPEYRPPATPGPDDAPAAPEAPEAPPSPLSGPVD